MEEIQKQLKQLYNNHAICCAPTGYSDWNRLTGGLVQGGLTLIGGRPAMGTTSLALNLAQRVSRKRGGTILFFSPDLREQDVCARLLQVGLGMSIGRLFDGSLHPEKAAEKCSALFASARGNIQAHCMYNLNMAYIYDLCFSLPDLQMVIVDSPENMKMPADRHYWYAQNMDLREPMDQVMHGLQDLAMLCDVPVVCTARLHRSIEQRKDKRPKLQDLAKINVPETAVDQVVFLYRDSYYSLERDNTAQCIVAKTPYGQTGTFSLQWHPETGEFVEL